MDGLKANTPLEAKSTMEIKRVHEEEEYEKRNEQERGKGRGGTHTHTPVANTRFTDNGDDDQMS